MNVNVPGPRHIAIFSGAETRITIPAKKNWFMLLFMLVWLTGWTLGEVSGVINVWTAVSRGQTGGFMVFWLLGWTIAGTYMLLGVLWQIAGQEIIQIVDGSFEIRYAIGDLGTAKRYALTDIKSLRVSPAAPLSIWNSRRNQSLFGEPGTLAFDYGSRTIRFGRSVDEAEAKQIVASLQTRYAKFK